MITILHGDNIVASRNRLYELRSLAGDREIITFTTSPDLPSLIQALESMSFFGTDRLVIIERFLTSLGRKTKDTTLSYLSKGDFQTDCIVWEPKLIGKSLLSLFPRSTRIEEFKLSKSLFTFLDRVGPGHTAELLRLFHQVLSEEEPELVLAMIVRQFRLLLSLKGQESRISEISRLAPWQRGKLERQAQQFTVEMLVDLYHRLFEIDLAIKTGQNLLSLQITLDNFLMEI